MITKEIFYPTSIAVIGASSDEAKEKEGWVGRLLEFGYEGKIYPINPKGARILGLKSYPSVRDVAGTVDYAIFNVPASLVPNLLKECADKKVKVAHIFSSGFKETGKDEGVKLEQEVERIVRETDIRVIGPNCVGIHCPEGRVTFARFPKRSGPAALVSQTGAGATRIVTYASKRGIYFSKVVSYGNAVDLESTDFLELLSEDPEVKFIGCYIEGVKDARRFANVVKNCMKTKPVVILKAGVTEASSQAAVSHTGALAGSEQIWQAFFKQSGAIRVDTLEEIVEQMVALQYISPPKGRRIGIIGRGGGPGVIATEICEKAGLRVVPFTPEVRIELERIIPAGSSVGNPVEIGLGRAGASPHYADAFEIIAASPHIDLILTHLNPDAFVQWGGRPEWLHYSIDTLLNIFRKLPKPVALVLSPSETDEARDVVAEAWVRCLDAGLAVFRSYEAAAKAISKLIQYHEFVRSVRGRVEE